jgi:hypothetical protein
MDDESGRNNPNPTARQLAASLSFPIDRQTFLDLLREVDQIDGKLEIRFVHSPVNGPTEDGNSTYYLPMNEPVYCTMKADDRWLVEFSGGEDIVAVVLSSETLFSKTDRQMRTANPNP